MENRKEVNSMATKTTDTAIREVIEKALTVYDMPEVCIKCALAYIDGLKAGAAEPPKRKEKGS